MARLFTSGCEWKHLTTTVSTAGSDSPDGSVLSTTNVVLETLLQRSGSACWKVTPTTNTPAYAQFNFSGVTGTTYYCRAYVMIPSQAAAPTSGVGVFRLFDTSAVALTASVGVQTITATGFTLGLTGGTESAEIPYGTWARIEQSVNINAAAGSDDSYEIRVNDVSLFSTTVAAIGSTAPGIMRVGFISTPGTSKVIYIDDVAINDSTGTAQNSWPGSGKVVLSLPISLNANGGSWTDSAAATTSAALTAAVDNTPPTGIADTTANAGHQDRNAAANTSLDLNLATYSSLGINAADAINVVVPMCNTGAPVVTGAKTGSLGITTNPTIANIAFVNGATAAANFWSGIAAGTYPAGWKWEKGTTTYNPAIIVGSSPVFRVTISAGTTSRIALVDAIGILIDYTPAAKSLVADIPGRRHSIHRRIAASYDRW